MTIESFLIIRTVFGEFGNKLIAALLNTHIFTLTIYFKKKKKEDF